MEIIVKKDILDDLQAKGFCKTAKESNHFFQLLLKEIGEKIAQHKKVVVENFGSFILGNDKPESTANVPDGNFLAEVSLAFSIEEIKVRHMVHTVVHFIKEMVLRNFEIQIIDFAGFRMEQKKPFIIKSPRKGQSSVIPERKILVFAPEKNLCEQAGVQEIRFLPCEEFQANIGSLKSSAILLLVPSKDFFVETFEYHFQRAGWLVHTTSDVEEAHRYIKSGKTKLALLDSQVPKYQGLCELIKCTKETSHIPMVIMYPKGVNLKKVKGFRICGDEHLLQPFEIKQLIAMAEQVLKRTIENKSLFKQEVLLQFSTVDSHIDKANEICGKLFSMSGVSEEGRISVAAAFREALANAAQHGNKHRRDKMLEVSYLLDKEKIITAVTDSGFGFDWRNYLNSGKKSDAVGRARQSHKEGRLGGLGIMLMLRCVDKIEYNDTGNVITITKYLNSS